MVNDMGVIGLVGRSSEFRILEELARAVQTSEGGALVIRGEPGIGKTALIDRLLRSTPGVLTLRAAGVESEMELPFAGLHQVCAPLFTLLPKLPASGTDWARGVEARSRALISEGEAAEAFYVQAIERLDRSLVRPEAARAHLVFGEWLRRENRRVEARHHLRVAYDQLSAMGMDAFAERAKRELATTGDTQRKRTFSTVFELTPQETQIARLAADGRTNPEIGAQLFISTHTVQYHLRKIFAKLGVSSRRELPQVVRPVQPP
jgi:DNA-binding CsgD family transcriptional regulator